MHVVQDSFSPSLHLQEHLVVSLHMGKTRNVQICHISGIDFYIKIASVKYQQIDYIVGNGKHTIYSHHRLY